MNCAILPGGATVSAGATEDCHLDVLLTQDLNKLRV